MTKNSIRYYEYKATLTELFCRYIRDFYKALKLTQQTFLSIKTAL